jgi:hypothetical protein
MAANPLKQMAKWTAWLLGACVLILFISEAFLRIHERFSLNKEQIEGMRYRARIIQIVQEQWLNAKPADPYLPPFLVYSDKGYGDDARLKKIFDSTRARPNVDATSWDFIRGPAHASQTTYRIRTNSLGFRGEERTVAKPEGTKRIIALGAYHTFGQGVNDEQTFPAQLEQELNRLDTTKKYEVWNGGRESDTAIVALARLKNEIFSYSPDLLIIDYGFVDPLAWSDNLMISAGRLPEGRLYAGVKALWRRMLPFLFQTRVFNAFIDFVVKRSYRHNVGDFSGAMQAIVSLASEKKIPVILLRQIPVEIADDVYVRLIKPGVKFIRVGEILKKTPLSNEALTECRSAGFWLREAPAAASNPRAENPFCYFLNALQLNAAGQKVLGQSLARTILQSPF